MATKTTYTQTCDLCGVEKPRGDFRRLGLVEITEGNQHQDPELDGPPVDVCPECRKRTIAELVTFVETSRRNALFRRGSALCREEENG